MYAQRGWRDESTGLFHYEYLSARGLFVIDGLTLIEGFNLCDELEAAGDDWEPVLQRWAQGYRNAIP